MEDFIFDDDVDEVGAEVEAHCPKCKADTQHVVISKYEDEIRRVQCNPCGDVHPYRKPRGESEEEHPQKSRLSLLQRLANVGLGRRDEEHEPPIAARATGPAMPAVPPLPRP